MLLEILFPRFCIGCNSYGKFICNKCRNSIAFFSQKDILRIPRPESLDKVVCIAKYQFVVKKIIKAIKYKLVYALFDELQEIIPKQQLIEMYSFLPQNQTVLQPIPLHVNKYKQRGFNQSELFANMFSKILQYPCSNLLERTIDTKPQALLRKDERKKNVLSAFTVINKQNVINKNIILIDDVFTTGETSNAAAYTLKMNDAKTVSLITFAVD